MEYRGYTASPIDFDTEDETFSGVVLGLKDIIHFEGSNAAALRASFEGGIDDYLAQCVEREEEPDRPFNGKILVRTEPALHQKAAMRAAAEETSLSQWITRPIAAA